MRSMSRISLWLLLGDWYPNLGFKI